MKQIIVFFLIVLCSSNLDAQNFADKDYYLIDSLVLEKLNENDSMLIEEQLKLFHSNNTYHKLAHLESLMLNAVDDFVYESYNKPYLNETLKYLDKFKEGSDDWKEVMMHYSSLGNKLFFAGDNNLVGGTGTELWVFDNLSSTTLTEIACPSYTYEGTEYTQSGDYEFTYTNTLGYDSVVTLQLTIDCGSVGIINLEEFEANVYPNPVIDVLNISTQYEIYNVNIFNILGEKVQTGSSPSFSIRNLNEGVYFIHIHTEKGIVNKQIIKN